MCKNTNEITRIADENTFRFDEIIFIGAATDGMSMTESLRDFIDEHGIDEIKKIIPGIPEWCTGDDEDFLIEAIFEAERYGFLVKVATPVKTFYVSGGASYSWGSYYTEWVYGDTFDDVVENARLWVEKIDKKCMEKQLSITA